MPHCDGTTAPSKPIGQSGVTVRPVGTSRLLRHCSQCCNVQSATSGGTGRRADIALTGRDRQGSNFFHRALLF